ncbi:hypothetical protein ABFG93_19280 [Pseudalkalibacillus hwajinpoensis]|uniref:hypothetical protein n=1 Tax=Guptibacillus hwajinpoensis TaxID=208199 RepID=UPI00325BA3AF
MKTLLLFFSAVFQVLIVVMLFVNRSWVPLLAIGYLGMLTLLIIALLKDKRNVEKEEKEDDYRNY